MTDELRWRFPSATKAASQRVLERLRVDFCLPLISIVDLAGLEILGLKLVLDKKRLAEHNDESPIVLQGKHGISCLELQLQDRAKLRTKLSERPSLDVVLPCHHSA